MARRITHIPLPYGNDSLEIQVPSDNLLGVARPKEVPQQAELTSLLREALRAPVDSPPFSTLLEGAKNILLVVDDITRPTPVHEILPVLLDELQVEQRGIEATILIALGTHRKMTLEEIQQKVGHEIAASYPVLNHEWDDPGALLDLGVTPNGTPIMVNRLIQQADVCLGIGLIVPHNLAGWSGGGKIVQPGICGKETTYFTHLLAARSPTSLLGTLENPVRAELEMVARQTNLTAIVNCILDRHGAVTHVVAGESRAAHRRGVALARPIWEVPVPRLADIVVVSSHPADIDFWQANKALYAAEKIVKRGGDIILLTPCPEGLSGQQEHVATLEALAGIPSRRLWHETRRQGLHDYAALTVSNISACCSELAWVTVVSDGLTEQEVGILGFDRAGSVEEALQTALKRQGEGASVLVLTHGGETVPIIRSEQS